jgi:hypothetical protein
MYAYHCCRSLGLGNDDAAQNMKYKAEDAASRAADTMKSAASGTLPLLNSYILSCTAQF